MTATEDQLDVRRGVTRHRVIGSVAVVVVVLAVAALVGQLSTPAPKPPKGIGVQMDSALPTSIANLPLVDEYGHATNLAAFHGKIVVLTDFMTLCQEVCPITTSELNEVDASVTKAGLDGKVQFVEITVDPQRDTPDQLHAYRAFADLHPNFSLLTGTSANLATLWKYLGVGYTRQAEDNPPGIDWRTHQPLTYDIEHTDLLMYFDPSGRERYVVEGMPNGTKAPLTAGERSFLDDEGRDNLTDTQDAAWTQGQALQLVGWLAGKHIHDVDG